ncbi:cytochrome c550 [Bacillus benzoevorans]|uniref:Cytochrome c550 n=1 Tax=Bacillus benzoevorans TaxID=1456 RepID=A0A7X0HSE2_9BACI|nr:cytochrome c [Bacillus benzoevorans]MBB6445999.1 cytochrome c550 [Bacillus benzoevorans]
MKRNPIMPFVVIMVVGVLAMFLFSFKGIGDSKQLADEIANGGKQEAPTEQVASNPEDIYKQSCLACHGDQYQGAVGPALKGVGDRRTKEEIQDIISTGTNNVAMPKGLVPADKAGEVAEWLMGL